MKTAITLSLVGILTTASITASADPAWRHDRDDYDSTLRARVVRVEPITRLVRIAAPQTTCYQQAVRTPVYNRRSDGAALVGGIVGGILGHDLGHGRGGSTVAGAIIGAAVGRSMADARNGYSESISYETRCYDHTRFQLQDQLIGYDVTYRYRGELYTTRMANRPGRFVRVNVSVSPEDY